MKYSEFLHIAKSINVQFNVLPLLFGSLGLERRLNTDLHADDIDILLPEYYLRDGWPALKALMEGLGYELYDLHEHAFQKGEFSAAFASLENLTPFAGVDVSQIPMMSDAGALYLLLDLLDYQRVYEASSKDGYRVNKKEKKDHEKLALIAQVLKKRRGKVMQYSKLVRDKIPEIIRGQGEMPNIRILEQDEYNRSLEAKLDEEVGEYHRDKNLEELADILEVTFSLAENLGYTREELLRTCEMKREKRGGFRDRIFLISKE